MNMFNRLRALLCAALCAASPAMSQNSPVLVELFTSQGCAACPPADRLLDQLADRDDVIALALHVDYWDYIGWTDSFGHSMFSNRQKTYARVKGRASVYTPQVVVGGIDEVKGSSRAQVMGTIATHLGMGLSPNGVKLTLHDGEGQDLTIEAIAEKGLPYVVDVILVRYRDSAQVDILGGENAGRSVTYRNIVTSWRTLDSWDGSHIFRHTMQIDGDEAVVVVVQEQGQGPVLATARRR